MEKFLMANENIFIFFQLTILWYLTEVLLTTYWIAMQTVICYLPPNDLCIMLDADQLMYIYFLPLFLHILHF